MKRLNRSIEYNYHLIFKEFVLRISILSYYSLLSYSVSRDVDRVFLHVRLYVVIPVVRKLETGDVRVENQQSVNDVRILPVVVLSGSCRPGNRLVRLYGSQTTI